jgi:hypothetical protein
VQCCSKGKRKVKMGTLYGEFVNYAVRDKRESLKT